MDLHTPGPKADWEQTSPDKITVWQRLAIASKGVCTPSNAISLAGLLLVLWGCFTLTHGNWPVGLVLIIIGRLADLLDGYVAALTQTKSRLGEIVDTACDKLSVLIMGVAAFVGHLLPLAFLIFLVAYNLYGAVFGMFWGRRYRLHANRFGKFAMFFGWIAIAATLLHTKTPNVATLVLSLGSILIYVGFAGAAMYTYQRSLLKALAKRTHNARWTHEITDMLELYNPNATHYRRADTFLQSLSKALGLTPTSFDITKDAKQFVAYMRSCKSTQNILITIAGGDGTISSIVNTLVKELPPKDGPKVYLLPAWGGNANDFSYMLNGLYTSVRLRRFLSSSAAVSIPLIKVAITSRHTKQTMYACCYASFGATAYATRQLESKRLSANTYLRLFPPLLVLRELFFVTRALLVAPLNVVEINGKEMMFYEHTLINGSRIAKVNRVPIALNEPAFMHALVERKHPAVLISIMRVLLGKSGTFYAKETSVSFTTKEPMIAQIDGEVIQLAAQTTVVASVANTPAIQYISMRLAPENVGE